MTLGRCVYFSLSPIFAISRTLNEDVSLGLFFAVSIFGDFREVANSAKIKPTRKISDIRYKEWVFFSGFMGNECESGTNKLCVIKICNYFSRWILERCFYWKHCKYKIWVSFLLGSRGINWSTEQTITAVHAICLYHSQIHSPWTQKKILIPYICSLY